jgi:hypothetical protein
MEEFYQENSEYSKLDVLAQLSLYIEKETNELMFVCDWDNTQDGVKYISQIIFELKYGDILERILQHLYSQCVENNRLDEFNEIKNNLSQLHKNKISSNNSIVVRPRDIK